MTLKKLIKKTKQEVRDRKNSITAMRKNPWYSNEEIQNYLTRTREVIQALHYLNQLKQYKDKVGTLDNFQKTEEDLVMYYELMHEYMDKFEVEKLRFEKEKEEYKQQLLSHFLLRAKEARAYDLGLIEDICDEMNVDKNI